MQVRFRTSELPEALWTAFVADKQGVREPDDWFRVVLDGEDHISSTIDELRAAEVKVYAVEPRRMNLEDAFIELIGSDRGLQVQRDGGDAPSGANANVNAKKGDN